MSFNHPRVGGLLNHRITLGSTGSTRPRLDGEDVAAIRFHLSWSGARNVAVGNPKIMVNLTCQEK